jgi:hypothetical protein
MPLMHALRLHARRLYLRVLLASAEYDQHWHEHQADRAASAADRDYWASLAASDRFVQQQLRVAISRVESALWPVRGVA